MHLELRINIIFSFLIAASNLICYLPITEICPPQRYDFATNGEMFLLKSYLKPGDVVFDVGANVGDWSLAALDIEPNLSVYCFEPTNSIFAKLVNNLKNHNAFYFNIALSDKKDCKKFYCLNEGQSEGNSLFFREIFKTREVQSSLIATDYLDSFCAMRNINKIDYLKIDVEGGEFDVLNGSNHLLHNHKITALQFEYGGCYLDAHITLKDILNLLTRSNYVIFRITSEGLFHISQWTPSLENYEYANYFAMVQSEIPEFCRMQGFPQ